MTGIHKVTISYRKNRYVIQLDRNISILTGDSGIGKTTIVRLMQQYRNNGKASGLDLVSDCEFVVAPVLYNDFVILYNSYKNVIWVLDEDCEYMFTDEFSKLAGSSTDYFLLIARHKSCYLQYDCKCIKTIKTVSNDDGGFTTELVDINTLGKEEITL